MRRMMLLKMRTKMTIKMHFKKIMNMKKNRTKTE